MPGYLFLLFLLCYQTLSFIISWGARFITCCRAKRHRQKDLPSRIFRPSICAGTGKTTTLAEIILHILQEKPNARILISSQSNVAVNHVLAQVVKDGKGIGILRIGRPERIGPGAEAWTREKQLSVWRESPMRANLLFWRLAHHLNNLSYSLNKLDQYQEALQIIEQAIALREQGYGYPGTLAASYGEKSQILLELDYLSLIEATYEKDTDMFWQYCRRLEHVPTREEMTVALTAVRQTIRLGLDDPKTVAIAQQFLDFLHERLHLPLELLTQESGEESPKPQQNLEQPPQSQQHLSAQAAKRFFEAVLSASGYEQWQVVIDPNATNARIEKGLRTIFLEDRRFWLHEIKHLFLHEFVGHVERRIAGERSALGSDALRNDVIE